MLTELLLSACKSVEYQSEGQAYQNNVQIRRNYWVGEEKAFFYNVAAIYCSRSSNVFVLSVAHEENSTQLMKPN